MKKDYNKLQIIKRNIVLFNLKQLKIKGKRLIGGDMIVLIKSSLLKKQIKLMKRDSTFQTIDPEQWFKGVQISNKYIKIRKIMK